MNFKGKTEKTENEQAHENNATQEVHKPAEHVESAQVSKKKPDVPL